MYNLDALLLNSIYCLFPLLSYLFYVAYTKNVGTNEDNLLFEIALFTIIYLNIKYGRAYFNVEPILLINIPLLVAYIKERKTSILLISLFIVYYYIFVIDFNPYLIIIEYLIYAIIYLGVKRKGLTNIYLINTFVLIKALILSFQSHYLIDNTGSDLAILTETFITISTFYVLSYVILVILNQCEKIIGLNMSIKELSKEKQLRESLFKITHEIKNPIVVCKGYLDMFDCDDKKSSEKYIAIIKQEIERILMLLDDFQTINKIKINKDILDINLLLDDVYLSMESLFKNNKITTKFNLDKDELYLIGDYNRLKQVFINIIKNAIEAIPDDREGIIEIDAKVYKKEVWITIKDNGVGIEETDLAKIGEAFYTTKTKGSGLGLFLSNEIIAAHDGKIIYDSIKGEGTTVTVKLNINYKNPILL
jgi:signal transduction histidine kinase